MFKVNEPADTFVKAPSLSLLLQISVNFKP